MKNKESDKIQRKIFQPTKETESKLNLICEATGMTVSDVVNSLFDTLGSADQMIEAYHRAKKEYVTKVREIMLSVLPEEYMEEVLKNKKEFVVSVDKSAECEETE